MSLEKKPLTAQRKQVIALSAVLVVLAMVVYYQFGSQAGTPAATSNVQTTGPNGATGVGGPPALPKPLDLGKLENVTADDKSARNPFKFYVPPPPPRPPAPPYVAPPPQQQTPQQPPVPQVPAIPLKFIGLQDGIIAVLSDGKGSVMTGKEGDVIDGQYRIVKIGMDTIIMEYVDGTGRRTIRMGG